MDVDRPTPVKYVLYSHFSAEEGQDFKAYNDSKGVPIESLKGILHLEKHFRGLRELLTTPGHEGMLVLFYALGFEDFLKGVAKGKSKEQLLADSRSLRFAKAFADRVREKLAAASLSQRVRFITSLDLRVILGRVNAIFADKFSTYFIGPATGIRYDTPKIVEAVLRLRLLGNGVPVLRLDHDVIFRGENARIGDLGLFKAVACSILAYHLRLEEPSVATFMFSASYNTRALLDPTYPDKFEAWGRAFATRIHPALVASLPKIRKIASMPVTTSEQKKVQDEQWNQYVASNLDEQLVRDYFGLRSTGLSIDGTRGLTAIGAHPMYAVISGALLCLSEGAILDLPPFSNFRHNVMWIDDHLKYSLHRELRHFTSGEELDLAPGLSEARLDEVMVTKARPAVSNLPGYTLGIYLPTLLLGTIVDAWITPASMLKCRFSELADEEKEQWRVARNSTVAAPLPKAMMEVLQVGHFSEDAQSNLEKELARVALRRMEQVRQIWGRLADGKRKSFAWYWARGEVVGNFPRACFEGGAYEDELWKGLTQKRPLGQRIESVNDLAVPVLMKLNDLIKDTLTYVKWALDWPRFLQIVRSVEQGTFAGDMSWKAVK